MTADRRVRCGWCPLSVSFRPSRGTLAHGAATSLSGATISTSHPVKSALNSIIPNGYRYHKTLSCTNMRTWTSALPRYGLRPHSALPVSSLRLRSASHLLRCIARSASGLYGLYERDSSSSRKSDRLGHVQERQSELLLGRPSYTRLSVCDDRDRSGVRLTRLIFPYHVLLRLASRLCLGPWIDEGFYLCFCRSSRPFVPESGTAPSPSPTVY
jgi:hypothetical protein